MAETLPAIKGNENYSVGKGCPSDDTSHLALSSNDKANNISVIAKNVGLDQKCQQEASLHSDQFMTDTKAQAFMFGPTIANTTTNNTLDHHMKQEGCGAFSLTANTMMNETNNITCNINSTFSSQTQTAKVGASINITTQPPTPDAITEIINHITVTEQRILSMSSVDQMPTMAMAGGDPAIFNRMMDLKQKAIAGARSSLELYMKKFPTSSGLHGSTLNLKLKQDVKMSSSQHVSAAVHTKIQNSVKNIAAAVAFNKINQVAGVDSLTSNSKQFLQNKITNAVNNQTNNIKSQISQNTMSLDEDGSINMKFAGPVVDSTINADLSSQAAMQINQVITSAVTIGQQVAAEITNQISSTNQSDAQDAGLADIIKASNDGLAKQIKVADEGQNKFFSGIFSMFGNLWLMLGIAAIAVLMFFPQVTKIFPPPIRFALMALIAVLIVFWFFGIWPFGGGKDNKEVAPHDIPLKTFSDEDGKNIGWKGTYVGRHGHGMRKRTYLI